MEYKIKDMEQSINFEHYDWENLPDNFQEDFLNAEQNVLKNYYDYIPWFNISISNSISLSFEFLCRFQDKLYWKYISRFQKLSEQEIWHFKDKVSWIGISEYQKLSEKFIEKCADLVYWENISEYQFLSEGFIKKYINKLDRHYLYFNERISKRIRKKYGLRH